MPATHIPSRNAALRFTRLRLNGFKSFTDPTELVIRDGLTGVVGPNGCGKSNLLEALRWVMGENRASAMRGGGMEDVIFAGTAARGARHFAEVALEIDNRDRLAPQGFNEADTIDIVRRITRDTGSAFRVNGREVRARDVQMLFADASTGAHSPALVRQGQIAELIGARPKARRRILEEAAGISGLYQRRHEASLRLDATEANLTRVEDVVEGLASQLAILARQAKQAARYREIGADLRRAERMLLWRRWREADLAVLAARTGLRERLAAAGHAERAAREAAEARGLAEAALPPAREEEAIAGAVLQRLTLQRDALAEREAGARRTVDTLRAQTLQLARDQEREATLHTDAHDTIARLEQEGATLAGVEDGHAERLARAAEAVRTAEAGLAERDAAMARSTEETARLSARRQSVQRALTDARGAAAKAQAGAARARTAQAEADTALTRATDGLADAEAALATATTCARGAESALTDAETARAVAQTCEATARAARSEAEGETTALKAEVAALNRLVASERAAGDQVLDLLTVAPGFEAALGAALGNELHAPLAGGGAESGWAEMPGRGPAAPLPPGADPIASHVAAPPALGLRLSQIGLVARADGAALQSALRPGQRLVSVEGDLWRWDGFRAAEAPSAAAARLRQLNRLKHLTRDMDRLAVTAGTARLAHEEAQAGLAQRTDADRTAREVRRAADVRMTDADRVSARAEADRTIAAGTRDAAGQALHRHDAEAREAGAALVAAEAADADLPDGKATREIMETLRTGLDAARTAMMNARAAHDALRRDGDMRTAGALAVATDLSGWRQRLATAQAHAADLTARRTAAEAELLAATRAPETIAAERVGLAEALRDAASRRTLAADALSVADAALREASARERGTERAAGEAREVRAGAEARVDAATEGRDAASARIAEAAQTTPQGLLDGLGTGPDTIPEADPLEESVSRLKRQRESLGAVNLRAEEDAEALQSEHDTLAAEKTDLEAAVRTLRAGIAGLNREGRERLLAAFTQVNASFGTLFAHLFGGGEARLVMVESDDPLEAGLEIMCQPPGKRLSLLSLLSGGEQTLTAMALIFAVFLANPAPICVLDEVDAPLDDANVTRFCDLLAEMTRRTDTRFLVITHHAVTMARMDRLFGVTMAEQGVSQLVSVDLGRAEAMVA